ncbi:MAG: DUF86 domain-containing protein [Calditrichaceae bacterium]
MPDKDIILEKITTIKRCLNRINDVTNLDPDSIEDFNIQDIFILNLQRAIQAAIDIAVHIVGSKGWGVSKTIKENFTLLADNRIITKNLAEQMTKMVGFRNIAIHDYSKMDIAILKSILTTSLTDLEVFYSTIYKKYIE